MGNTHPGWSYARVPNGDTGDATEAMIAQIERFAPGFRERIIRHTVRSTTQMAAYGPKDVGGDIMTGAKDIRELTFGPRITLSPRAIGVPGRRICSAATPPAPGAHGICGTNSAQAALGYLVTVLFPYSLPEPEVDAIDNMPCMLSLLIALRIGLLSP